MLENDGFVPIGRATFEPPSKFLVEFHRSDAESWWPAIYAFRAAGQVIRIGKCDSTTLREHMNKSEGLVSRALAGHFVKGGTNPWEAFTWRKILTENADGAELLARRGNTAEKPTLIKRYDPPLCNDSLCAQSRPSEARRVREVSVARAYWKCLNDPSVSA